MRAEVRPDREKTTFHVQRTAKYNKAPKKVKNNLRPPVNPTGTCPPSVEISAFVPEGFISGHRFSSAASPSKSGTPSGLEPLLKHSQPLRQPRFIPRSRIFVQNALLDGLVERRHRLPVRLPGSRFVALFQALAHAPESRAQLR